MKNNGKHAGEKENSRSRPRETKKNELIAFLFLYLYLYNNFSISFFDLLGVKLPMALLHLTNLSLVHLPSLSRS